MKPVRFRLKPVLELRRTQERAAALAAADATQAAADADRRATERETALAAAPLPTSTSGRTFVATMTVLGSAAADAAAARALATASAEQAELVRAEWTAAAQRTKGLERLEERHRLALRSAEDAAQERLVDDLVTGRARLGATDSTAAATPPGEVPWTP